MTDTICAISTPSGVGGIAVVRLSGDKAVEIVATVLHLHGRTQSVQECTPYHVYLADFMDEKEVLDQTLVSIFKAPHSYTGENVVEVSCHGSSYVQQRILEVLIHAGARLARAGEFTERAFLNGKLDLSQAEAIADIIHAESKQAHQLAVKQLRGGVSRKIAELRSQLLQFASLIELELDFSEEDIQFADRTQLLALLGTIKADITQLTDSFKLGGSIKQGIPVAIVGKPNVGKSTFLNAVLNDDRALVSDIPGTTRDTIEEKMTIHGVHFRLIDTAGIRQSKDTIETMGIERAYKAIEQAQIVLCIIENSRFQDVEELLDNIDVSDKQLLILVNKTEHLQQSGISEYHGHAVFYMAAKYNKGIAPIVQRLSDYVQDRTVVADTVLISNVRHYEALTRAGESLKAIEQGFQAGLSSDLIAIDIRMVINELGAITGEISNDEILQNIFGRFCIGK
ncbi:tRNA modification GTPase MnmE [Bacteroidia bacterium]|nr:tRNA modification GTPase MnmE [Bacteroidia bacterium]